MRQVAAALGIDRLQAQVTLTYIVSTTTRQGIFRAQVLEVPGDLPELGNPEVLR